MGQGRPRGHTEVSGPATGIPAAFDKNPAKVRRGASSALGGTHVQQAKGAEGGRMANPAIHARARARLEPPARSPERPSLPILAVDNIAMRHIVSTPVDGYDGEFESRGPRRHSSGG